MISWLAFTYSLVLLGVTVAVLAWVYRRTRLPTVLTYLLYAVFSKFLVLGAYRDTIVSGDAGRWLGTNPGDRAVNYFVLTTVVENTVQTLLFVWLVWSLVRWSRSRPDGMWRGARLSAPTLEQKPDAA